VDATRGYGADVVLVADIKAAFAEARRREQGGMTAVHPFDDALVAAGQGTTGLEILEDLPALSRVYVSIGGGALIAGVAAAVRSQKPSVRVIGVQTEGANAMARSLSEGRLVELPAITSIARTLGAPKVSEFTLGCARQWVERVTAVSDAEAFAALEFLLERTKTLVEPAASCCLAALERDRETLSAEDQVVLLLCGGNVSPADLCGMRERFGLNRSTP
jgi:threonine dehydratase